MAEIVTGLFGQVKTPMRFWSNPKLLHKYKRYCQQDCEYYLLTPSHYIPDFQIMRPVRPNAITKFQLQLQDGTVVIDSVAGPDSLGGLIITAVGNYEYITYRGRLILPGPPMVTQSNLSFVDGSKLDCTEIYQIVIGDDVDEWVSEPFKAVDAAYNDEIDLLDGNGISPSTSNGWSEDTGSWSYGSGTACKTTGADAQLSYYIAPAFSQYFLLGSRAEISIRLSSLTYVGFANADCKIYFDGNLIGTVPLNSAERIYTFDGIFSGGGLVSVLMEENVGGCISDIEVLPLTDNLECHYKLTWTNSCDIFNMLNTFGDTPLQNEYFLPEDTELGKPDYKKTIEGTENGNKKIVNAFKKRAKRHFLEFGLIPEYILDAIFDVQFFETVTLHLKHNAGTLQLSDIDVDYSWRFSEQCYATANISFSLNDDGVETGCCDNLTQVPCPEPCSNEVDGILEETETPVEGSVYVSNVEGQFLVTYHDPGPNDLVACESGYVLILGVLYHFDGSTWREVGVEQVYKIDQYNLNESESLVFGYIPPGFYAQIELEYGVTTTVTVDKYTPEELAAGITINPVGTVFTVRIIYSNANCDPEYTPDYDIDWGLRAKISNAYNPAAEWFRIYYDCPPIYHDFTPDHITIYDLATLEAALEGGVVSAGAYDMSTDADYIYIEKTDADISCAGAQFDFSWIEAAQAYSHYLFVFDRNHLEWETGQ